MQSFALMLAATTVLACGSTAAFGEVTPADQSAPPEPQGLAEIVVTAQHRTENIQKVPITINAITSQALANAGATQLSDLATIVSGFVAPGDNSNRPPHLRGVGSQAIVDGNDSAVAYYIDGVYMPNFNPAVLSLNYTDRVEILKGPQGTLFGRNSTAGLISIISRTPSDSLEAEAEGGYANYRSLSGSAYIGGPIASGIRANIAVQASNQLAGWGKNLFDGRDVHQKPLVFSARSKWLIEPATGTKITFIADYEQYRSVGGLTARPVSGEVSALGTVGTATGWNTDVNQIDSQKSESGGAALKIEQDLGFATLSSLSAYRITHGFPQGFDYDATNVDGVTVANNQHNHQFSEELQLIGHGGSPLQWQAGAYFLNSRDEIETYLAGALMAPELLDVAYARQKTTSISAYGQATYRMLESTRLTLGLRYTRETRRMTGDEMGTFPLISGGTQNMVVNQTRERVSQGNLTWRIALDHDFASNVLGYASVNRGFKSGGFNLDVITNPPYLAEQLTAYEIGLKMQTADRKIRVNTSAFFYNYNNIQIVGALANSLVLFNGPNARIYGLDLDVDAQITRNFTISGSFEALSAKLRNFKDAPIYSPNGPAVGGYTLSIGDVSGRKVPWAPGVTGSLSAVYKIPTSWGDWQFVAMTSYNSGFYTEVDNRVRQNAYALLEGNISYTLPEGHAWVKIWGKNLTNRQIANYFYTTPVATQVVLDSPRTYGFTIGYKY